MDTEHQQPFDEIPNSHYERALDDYNEIQRLKSEQKINSLTGLPNKKALEEFVGIFDSRSHDMMVTYIDLQGFGEINRTIGHDKADEKLCNFAKFFESEIRRDDFLFHLHGDEFVLLSSKRSKPGELVSPEEGLKHHLELINKNSEVKFGFFSVTFDKFKHKSLSDAIIEADKNLMSKKEEARRQKSQLNLADQVSTNE